MLIVVGLLMSSAHLFALADQIETRPVPVTLSAEERERISRHPVMRVGIPTDWAPFSYLGRDGKVSGIDIDILDLISQRTGLRFELLPKKSWLELATNWDQFDMVCSVGQSPLREQVAVFTKEYYVAPLVIVQREGEEIFGTAGVHANKTLALPRKHLSTQVATNRIPSARVILTEDLGESFELVEKRKADATVASVFVVSQYLNSHPRRHLAISGVMVRPSFPLKMALNRNHDYALPLLILNKGLASISEQEMDDIFARHLLFGLESRERVGLLQKRTKQVFITAAMAGLFLVLWNFLIRKEIRARRKAEAELREAHESMKIFSHSLSHDLRAPLRGINGFALVLKDDCCEKLSPEEQSYLDRIITSVSHMDRMISDVLTYSRATNLDWPMETVELDPLVQQLIEGFPLEQRKYFQIVSKLPAVRGHATLLSQSLGNLLSNAIDYVPKDRTPRVEISATEEDSKVTVSVTDNGIGIEPKDQKRIFRIFERAAPAVYKGTGIGLAIVAKATERMGGRIGVESEVGQGTRFWMQLPAAGVPGPVSA